MLIRSLSSLEECRTAAQLEKTIWDYTDDDVIPALMAPAVVAAVQMAPGCGSE